MHAIIVITSRSSIFRFDGIFILFFAPNSFHHRTKFLFHIFYCEACLFLLLFHILLLSSSKVVFQVLFQMVKNQASTQTASEKSDKRNEKYHVERFMFSILSLTFIIFQLFAFHFYRVHFTS